MAITPKLLKDLFKAKYWTSKEHLSSEYLKVTGFNTFTNLVSYQGFQTYDISNSRYFEGELEITEFVNRYFPVMDLSEEDKEILEHE